MNNMWGSMLQYEHIYWGWEIAVYLFLAGLSAGAMLVCIYLRRAGSFVLHSDGNCSSFNLDSCFKSGVLLAPICISLGLLLLVFDLGKPLSFYWILLKYNFDSVMSIGVVLLLFYSPLAFLYATFAFFSNIKFIRSILFLRPIVEVLLFILSIGVGVYTGFLLSAIQKVPLWDNVILPFLFLASGLSAGISFCILIGITIFKSSINKVVVSKLLHFDMIVIFIEFILLLVLFAVVFSSNTNIELSNIFSGVWGFVFFVFIIGVGFVLPILIDLLVLKNHNFKPTFIVLNCCCVLVGVLALRYFIVYAGQISI